MMIVRTHGQTGVLATIAMVIARYLRFVHQRGVDAALQTLATTALQLLQHATTSHYISVNKHASPTSSEPQACNSMHLPGSMCTNHATRGSKSLNPDVEGLRLAALLVLC